VLHVFFMNTQKSMNVKCVVPIELIPVIDNGLAKGKSISEIIRDGLRALAEKEGILIGESKEEGALKC
jgi:Arc/MetJ-type ribon-helix-helix transcriptional regulator